MRREGIRKVESGKKLRKSCYSKGVKGEGEGIRQNIRDKEGRKEEK